MNLQQARETICGLYPNLKLDKIVFEMANGYPIFTGCIKYNEVIIGQFVAINELKGQHWSKPHALMNGEHIQIIEKIKINYNKASKL